MMDDGVLPIANEPTTGSMREHLVGALARVIPKDIRIATAYLTPDGFLDVKVGMANAVTVRLLLGERPFMNRRGPGDVLSQPGDHDELDGPAESVDWYTFLEGGYPWLLLTHEERRDLLARGVTPEQHSTCPRGSGSRPSPTSCEGTTWRSGASSAPR